MPVLVFESDGNSMTFLPIFEQVVEKPVILLFDNVHIRVCVVKPGQLFQFPRLNAQHEPVCRRGEYVEGINNMNILAGHIEEKANQIPPVQLNIEQHVDQQSDGQNDQQIDSQAKSPSMVNVIILIRVARQKAQDPLYQPPRVHALELDEDVTDVERIDNLIDRAEKNLAAAKSEAIWSWFSLGRWWYNTLNENAFLTTEKAQQNYATERYRQLSKRTGNVTTRLVRARIIYNALKGLSMKEILAIEGLSPRNIIDLGAGSADEINTRAVMAVIN